MAMENIADNQGKLGKLKFIRRARDAFSCDECKNELEAGSPCYDQSDYRGEGFFPKKIRICVVCGEIKIKGGTKVKEKKSSKKKIKETKKEMNKETKNIVIDPSDGCGKDTEYPKADGSGVWKCGEKSLVVGIMRCSECGGL